MTQLRSKITALQLAKNASRVERRGVLTARQQQIAVLVQQGLSNKEIARELRLSKGTVKLHVHNILVTVGARSRREVIVAAIPEANPTIAIASRRP